ncbi:MAG TPA: hypothetical protein VFQ61_38230, partial [Polyangiaceae bacterium]|nr:hypothetical protein [Polyangiaceae bacterium]
ARQVREIAYGTLRIVYLSTGLQHDGFGVSRHVGLSADPIRAGGEHVISGVAHLAICWLCLDIQIVA